MITHTVCSAATFSRVIDPDTGVFRESDPGLDPGYLYQDPPAFLDLFPIIYQLYCLLYVRKKVKNEFFRSK